MDSKAEPSLNRPLGAVGPDTLTSPLSAGPEEVLRSFAVTENLVEVVSNGDDDEAADRARVERERSEIREFVKGLTPDEIKSGGWFTRLLSMSLNS